MIDLRSNRIDNPCRNNSCIVRSVFSSTWGLVMSSSDPEEAWRRFYQEYGNAMVTWQILESEIATLFSYLTKIPLPMAVQIYYSARSFNGRLDVYKGGVAASGLNAEAKAAARKIARKAKDYAEYRNKFAHDLPLLRQTPPTFDILMVDGRGQFQSDEVRRQYISDGIAIDEITYAATCFRQLADLTRHFWVQHRGHGDAPHPPHSWLETLRERLLALPNLPRKEALFPPSAAPKRPHSPSQG